MDNLILTGYGWTEYAVAAAIALKGLDGLADVAGVSKRRLPELLEATAKGVRNVCILGVALGGDEVRLAAALKALRRRGVSVTWISAVAASESQRRDVLPFMKSVVDESVALPEVVGRTFGVDAAPFLPYAEDGGRVSAAVRDYRELFEAAQFFYRYYQDETVYAATIRSLAAGVQPAAWGEDVRRVVEHYRPSTASRSSPTRACSSSARAARARRRSPSRSTTSRRAARSRSTRSTARA